MNLRLAVFLLLVFAATAVGQTSFWTSSALPTLSSGSSSSITLGLRFYSDVPGAVTGVRFYKGTANTGTHTGQLWTANGTRIGNVTFSNETASGWQQAKFAAPITIAAHTTYIISYVAPSGHFAYNTSFAWSNVSASPLHVSGTYPGVYASGTGPIFPSAQSASNFWVDVIFTPSKTLWPSTAKPTNPDITYDSNSVNLGVKFQSSVAGYVTGVRFYKGSGNLGTHVGTLWSGTGTKLAQVTFTGETASGWQQARFPTPVKIAANTVYVISYLAPLGNYAQDGYYSWSDVSASPLRVSGASPGVFVYGTTPLFPTGVFNASNYWVDVIFIPDQTSTTTTYSIAGTVSGSAATVTLSGTTGAITKTNSSGAYLFNGLMNGTYVVAPSQTGYAFTPSTASVSINGSSVSGVNFTAKAVTVSHSVSLSWVASTSTNVIGYNIYRSTVSGGPYTRISGSLVSGTSYVDSTVAGGGSYYYVATAVDINNNESVYSAQVAATVPL